MGTGGDMKKTRWAGNVVILALAVIIFNGYAFAQEGAGTSGRLRRADSFLGIHFDFHAGYDCTEVGKNVTPEMIQRVIDQVHPDYIQCDCKGHPGISSYPTKVGNPAPGFVRDQLKIWRDVTAENGVALYMHYSGVWDNEAVKKNPEWARIDENGNRDNRLTSVFGDYTRDLLIPQFKELNDVYGVDGVWVDGECWATERDYSEKALKLFREKTGITKIPKAPEDEYWFEFSEFNRQGFRDHLKEYTDALHDHNPDFQVCSNWAFSSHMPESVTVDVDFISGDFSARNSVNAGRFEGRCMVHQGKPWDLMAWSFTWGPGIYSTKSVPQLMREAALVISLGGGFQAYFPQNRDGSVRQWEWDMNVMGQVAKFCRDRQAICHKAEPIPQIALVYSSYAFYRSARKVFSAWHGEHDAMRGILQNLLDTQNSVEIVSEHHLEGRMSDYPLIIWPEWEYIDPVFRRNLVNYVRDGGNLLIVGPKAAALFEGELGITLEGEPVSGINGLANKGWLSGLETVSQKAVTDGDTETFGLIYLNSRNDMSGETIPAASIRNLGKGKIAATYLNLGERYLKARTAHARDFLNDLVRELFPDPMVEVYGSHDVDVVLNRKDGKLAVNLVNTAGEHENDTVFVIDEIPPVGPVSVAIRTPHKPANIILEPGKRDIHWNYIDGKVIVSVPEITIHEIIVIEP